MVDETHKARPNIGRIYKTCKWGMIQGGTKTILEKFKLCKEAGFDGVELINPLNFGDAGAEKAPEQNDPKVGEVLAASRETGMPVHGLVNILGNRKAHIASPDEATARERPSTAGAIGAELSRLWRKCRAAGTWQSGRIRRNT